MATPEGWVTTTLDALAEIKRGASPRPINDHKWFAEIGRGWVRISDVTRSGRHLLATTQYLSPEGEARSVPVDPGDVIMSIAGSIGKPIHVGIPACIHDGFIAFKNLRREISPDWLIYFLLSQAATFAAAGQQGTQTNLNSRLVGRTTVTLPPLPEQRKIAAILSAVDEVIEKTEAVIQSLQALKKAMMQELLTRGLPGRHTRFKQTEIGEVPEEWEVVRAKDVCQVITKGATPAEQTSEPGGVRFLKVYNLHPDGFIDFDYRPTFIPARTHQGELKRSQIRANDVLMNIVGPPLGKVAVVPEDWPDANINQAIAVFRPAAVESCYLATCLATPHLFTWAATRAKRTSTQLNLTLELCRDYPLPLPPREEREQIVRATDAVSARLRSETNALRELNSTKSALMSVLLTGELRVTPDQGAA